MEKNLLIVCSQLVPPRLVLERIKCALDTVTRIEQAGFRQLRLFTDQVVTLRLKNKLSLEWQPPFISEPYRISL